MSILRLKNFTNERPIIDADQYEHCNFSRPAPVIVNGLRRGVKLWPTDDTPRIFIDCNLINCEPPPGSTITRCNTWMTEYRIPTREDTVTIDGQSLVVEHHSNFTYAKLNDDLTYTDLPTPRELVVDL